MKHTLSLDGYSYKLRPVTLDDAAFILKIRIEDKERTRYLHAVPDDLSLEEKWIEEYFQRAGDYFFVIENKFTGEKEGTIAIYDEIDGKAEWGRWVLQKGSMASVESVYLLYSIAFHKLNLNELFCRTVEDNQSVVAFHTSTGLKTRAVLNEFFCLDGVKYNSVEQYVDKELFFSEVGGKLSAKCFMVFQRFLRNAVGKFEFHHIGIACRDIDREVTAYRMLGYQFEEKLFVDSNQGITGKFGISKNQPRIELLQNLENSTTLNTYLEKGIKMYHFAYTVSDIDKAVDYIMRSKGRVVSPLKESSYFRKRICFLMLSNMFLIELIEE